ncbi:hypothetical protein B0H14DRAFT_3859487 [Mycena olivaceomarginata]|nr:hypothetical protein B0H14DRAFT_3859487 [Mycena olivaceomarginata]
MVKSAHCSVAWCINRLQETMPARFLRFPPLDHKPPCFSSSNFAVSWPGSSPSQNYRISRRNLAKIAPPKNIDPETVRTAPNDLDFALRALTSLEITGRVEQTPANAQGLAQLAARIERITPIVNEMAHMNASKGQTIVQELQRELASMTQDLKDARSKGKLNQFFGSADKGSPLERHNTALAKLIADSTGVKVDEVLGSLCKIEGNRVGQEVMATSAARAVRAGGPQLEMDPDERYRIGNISGGTGGTGGDGIEVGGRAGWGRVR